MLGFLLGVTAGSLLRGDRGGRRRLATLLVKGQDTLSALGVEVQRVAAQAAEDLDDIVAEARKEREDEKQAQSGG